jgi:phosphoribosylaminoimidazolecarboxamide formyltransferase/IMP cyclohydrolase
MPAERVIKTALISVYNKENLEPLVRELHRLNVELISTGGTFDFIKKLGIGVKAVEDLTGYPSILGGRVKTLHPSIFGGILGRTDNASDLDEMEKHGIASIDLVIVDLYPFGETVVSGGNEEEIIEKIDIGGIALIRGAAKNFNNTLIISHREDYGRLLDLLRSGNGSTGIDTRREFAKKAFYVSSQYDTQIFSWFSGGEDAGALSFTISPARPLRYGENPHQPAVFFGKLDDVFEQLNGKELSYNNLVDIDAAVQLLAEFSDTGFAVIKHTNPCGIALSGDQLSSWKNALAGDPVSAFGGIIIANRELEMESAMELDKLFFEVLVAPAYNSEALELLKKKKNRIILQLKQASFGKLNFKSLLNGVIKQEKDSKTESREDLKFVTEKSPGEREIDDLLFAAAIAKHAKSNTIVLAKNRQLLGIGCGQTSRVDALHQAISKAHSFGFDLKGSVMASDAFFPFPDCVEIAHNAGITAVIQPGGSIKDDLSIAYCNTHGLPMVFTGFRHFRH